MRQAGEEGREGDDAPTRSARNPRGARIEPRPTNGGPGGVPRRRRHRQRSRRRKRSTRTVEPTRGRTRLYQVGEQPKVHRGRLPARGRAGRERRPAPAAATGEENEAEAGQRRAQKAVLDLHIRRRR